MAGARRGATPCVAAMLAMALTLALASSAGAFVGIADEGSEARFNLPGEASFDGNLRSGLYQMSRAQFTGAPNPPPLFDVVEQSYWYRIGNGPEQRLDSMTFGGAFTIDKDLDGDPDRLSFRYDDVANHLSVNVTYDILGGTAAGGHKTNLSRLIQINNTGPTPLDLHFFDYSDLSLTNGFPGDDLQYPDFGEITGARGNAFRVFDQDDGPGGVFDPNMLNSDSLTLVTPDPSHFEIALNGITGPGDILSRLTDGSATTLADNANVMIGSGDLAFAAQWDRALSAFGQPGSSFLIIEQTLITPEPAAGAMLLAGLFYLSARRPRRRRRTAR